MVNKYKKNCIRWKYKKLIRRYVQRSFRSECKKKHLCCHDDDVDDDGPIKCYNFKYTIEYASDIFLFCSLKQVMILLLISWNSNSNGQKMSSTLIKRIIRCECAVFDSIDEFMQKWILSPVNSVQLRYFEIKTIENTRWTDYFDGIISMVQYRMWNRISSFCSKWANSKHEKTKIAELPRYVRVVRQICTYYVVSPKRWPQ